jgi:serine/threonine-protein kinase CTR1
MELRETPAPLGAEFPSLLLDPADRERDRSFKAIRGSFVSKLKRKSSGEVSAARELDSSQMDSFYLELEMLLHLRHPNILGIIGFYLPDAANRIEPTIVTEWMPKGSLDRTIYTPDQAKALSDTDKMKIIVSIVLGMRYIHASGIAHRDLSAGSVLLSRQFGAKIGGFALAMPKHDKMDGHRGYGRAPYMAPEVGTMDEVCLSSDVYSFGILLWEIVRCDPAFRDWMGKNPMFIHNQVINGARPDTAGIPPGIKDLMERCWAQDPNRRPTFAQVFEALQRADFRLLPNVQSDVIAEYVGPILAWEGEHPPRRFRVEPD